MLCLRFPALPRSAFRLVFLACAAAILGVEKDTGTVEPGKYADLVALPGDPLADMTLVLKPSFVMKAGVIYKQP